MPRDRELLVQQLILLIQPLVVALEQRHTRKLLLDLPFEDLDEAGLHLKVLDSLLEVLLLGMVHRKLVLLVRKPVTHHRHVISLLVHRGELSGVEITLRGHRCDDRLILKDLRLHLPVLDVDGGEPAVLIPKVREVELLTLNLLLKPVNLLVQLLAPLLQLNIRFILHGEIRACCFLLLGDHYHLRFELMHKLLLRVIRDLLQLLHFLNEVVELSLVVRKVTDLEDLLREDFVVLLKLSDLLGHVLNSRGQSIPQLIPLVPKALIIVVSRGPLQLALLELVLDLIDIEDLSEKELVVLL